MSLVSLMATYEPEAAFGRSNVGAQYEMPSALMNDMALPCDTCPLADSCASKLTECSAFRTWSKNGQYKDSDVGRYVRAIKS